MIHLLQQCQPTLQAIDRIQKVSEKRLCVEPKPILENMVISIQYCNQPLSTYFIIEQKAKNQSSNYKYT